MLDISRDKDAIWRRIRGDPEIRRLLHLTGENDVEAIRHIRKTKAVPDELKNDSRYICIYFLPNVGTGSQLFFEMCLQIDVFMPIDASRDADDALTRIIGLLTDGYFAFNNHAKLSLDGPPMELTATGGFYCIAQRFYYHSSTRVKL